LDEAEEPEYDSADSDEDFMRWKDRLRKEAEQRWAAWLEPENEAAEVPFCTIKQIDQNANDSVTCDREGQIEVPEKGLIKGPKKCPKENSKPNRIENAKENRNGNSKDEKRDLKEEHRVSRGNQTFTADQLSPVQHQSSDWYFPEVGIKNSGLLRGQVGIVHDVTVSGMCSVLLKSAGRSLKIPIKNLCQTRPEVGDLVKAISGDAFGLTGEVLSIDSKGLCKFVPESGGQPEILPSENVCKITHNVEMSDKLNAELRSNGGCD